MIHKASSVHQQFLVQSNPLVTKIKPLGGFILEDR
jgi:hypothetical protein